MENSRGEAAAAAEAKEGTKSAKSPSKVTFCDDANNDESSKLNNSSEQKLKSDSTSHNNSNKNVRGKRNKLFVRRPLAFICYNFFHKLF